MEHDSFLAKLKNIGHFLHGTTFSQQLKYLLLTGRLRVNAVGSGDVVTNLLNTFRSDGRDFLAQHGRSAPIKRAASPEEIAEVVAFLASEKASFMVGAIVMADGGMSIAVPAD